MSISKKSSLNRESPLTINRLKLDNIIKMLSNFDDGTTKIGQYYLSKSDFGLTLRSKSGTSLICSDYQQHYLNLPEYLLSYIEYVIEKYILEQKQNNYLVSITTPSSKRHIKVFKSKQNKIKTWFKNTQTKTLSISLLNLALFSYTFKQEILSQKTKTQSFANFNQVSLLDFDEFEINKKTNLECLNNN